MHCLDILRVILILFHLPSVCVQLLGCRSHLNLRRNAFSPFRSSAGHEEALPGGLLPAGRGRKGAVSHVGRGRRCRGAPRRLTQSFYERVTTGFERGSSRPFRTRNVLQTHAVVPPSSPFSAGALPGSARLVLRARRFPRLRFIPALLSLARIPSAPDARGSAP